MMMNRDKRLAQYGIAPASFSSSSVISGSSKGWLRAYGSGFPKRSCCASCTKMLACGQCVCHPFVNNFFTLSVWPVTQPTEEV